MTNFTYLVSLCFIIITPSCEGTRIWYLCYCSRIHYPGVQTALWFWRFWIRPKCNIKQPGLGNCSYCRWMNKLLPMLVFFPPILYTDVFHDSLRHTLFIPVPETFSDYPVSGVQIWGNAELTSWSTASLPTKASPTNSTKSGVLTAISLARAVISGALSCIRPAVSTSTTSNPWLRAKREEEGKEKKVTKKEEYSWLSQVKSVYIWALIKLSFQLCNTGYQLKLYKTL